MPRRRDKSEAYISVDIEAAGPIPGKYSMLSIGACVVGQPEVAFYRELKPLNMDSIPEALSVSRLSLEGLVQTGMPARDALLQCEAWLANSCEGKQAVFVGFNAVFDWSFINWYFHEFLGKNPFGHGGIDIKSYYMGLAGTSWAQSSFSQLPAAFQPDLKQTHNALDDARSQAEVFESLLNWHQNGSMGRHP